MPYGDKTDYRKIDIYVRKDGHWSYVGSTTRSRSCKEAKERYWAAHPGVPLDTIKTRFNERTKL